VNGAQLPSEVTRKDARAGNDVVTLIRHEASAGRIRSSIVHSSLMSARRAPMLLRLRHLEHGV
jgi:hypothetical protein